MRIIFFGSDDFAAAHLKYLFESKQNVVACVAPPDKAKGRGMKVSFSAVKECALKNNVKIFQPETLSIRQEAQDSAPPLLKGAGAPRDSQIFADLKSLNPDLFIVIAYGKLLPQNILDIPSKFCINLHASLLPKYRGAGPINWAIINDEKQTGLSVIKMSSQMDAGDILAQMPLKIDAQETAVTLRKTMMEVGPQFLVETIQAIKENRHQLKPQNEKAVTLAPKLTKELGQIDWTKSAEEIRNLIRGLLPWPTAYTFYEGKILKILKAQVVEKSGQPGEIVEINSNNFVIATGKKSLLVEEVHLQDARPMDTASFLRGHKLKVEERLG